MVSMNWWNNKQEENWKRDARLQVLQTVKRAEKAVKSNMKNLFTDVCDVMPRHLAKQYDECATHLRKYPDEYPIDNFSKS
jgi:2-oxoisovalerate dehydrogenase E1 component alpha subunit